MKIDIKILGKLLLEGIKSAALTVVPDEAARAADDVQEMKHERVVGEQNQISLRQKKIVVRLLPASSLEKQIAERAGSSAAFSEGAGLPRAGNV